MKSKKLIWCVMVLATILIIMQLPVTEADAAASASDFKMEGSTLVKYQGTDKNVSVPNTVEVIGRGAFEENKNIELVVLPNSVKSIEPYAFWGCDNLDTVVLGKGLGEIGDYAFAGCKGLVQMSVPSNVTSIGIQSFGDCIKLKDISIPPETGSIHETAFDGCVSLTIHCDQGSAADEYAQSFYERQKKMPGYQDPSDSAGTVTPGPAVPDPIEPDPSEPGQAEPSPEPNPTEPPAEVNPGDVLGFTQVVGNTAVIFADNRQLQVYGGRNTVQGSSGSEDASQADGSNESSGADSINGGFGNSEDSSGDAESSKVSLEDVFQDSWNGSIPKYAVVDGKVVADYAYYRRENLGGVALPEGIREIGQFSFARSSATSVIVPEGTEKIGYGAFYHCDDLSDVMLPDSIMCVEPKAFEHTLWVQRFINGTQSAEGLSEAENQSRLEGTESDFLVEGGVLVAYRGNAEKVSIPDGVRVIAGEAFYNHAEIKSVVIPDGLLVIGEGAFEGCSNLAQIEWGNSVEVIKDRAFKGTAVTEITVPASVKKLGLQAFGSAMMTYAYGEPEYTYETSAGRLANGDYRSYGGAAEQEPGVTVSGAEGAEASLEGADRSYTLEITVPEDLSDMEAAFRRSFRTDISPEAENVIVYGLTLNDGSKVPLTQLGSQKLAVTIPVPEAFKEQEVRLFTLDRNGQLEVLPAERISIDESEAIKFQTSYLSKIAIIGWETADSGE